MLGVKLELIILRYNTQISACVTGQTVLLSRSLHTPRIQHSHLWKASPLRVRWFPHTAAPLRKGPRQDPIRACEER